MNRALINGTELEYEARGTGDPIVLVHGSHIADAFVPLLNEPALAEQYQLVQYHRRGFAGSASTDDPVDIAQQAEDCRAVMQHLGIARAHIVGHSFGGAIALQLALDTPEAVHSLALLEPALVLVVPSAQQFMEAMAPVVQLYEAGNKADAVDAFLQAIVGPEYRSVVDRVLPGAFAQAVADADTFFKVELPALSQWDFTQADAGRVTQPVLYVSGADSNALWPGWIEVQQLVKAYLPQTETFVLKDATHGLQIMQPKSMAEALADFFKSHPMPKEPAAPTQKEDGGEWH